MKTIIIDTGYWIALFNPEKNLKLQDDVKLISEIITNYKVLVPFPTLYEFLNSKFSRNKNTKYFRNELSKPNYIKVDDSEYKERALNKFFEKTNYTKSEDISLVDEVIKEMIDDINLKTDYLVTFDEALKNYAVSKNVETI